VRICEDMPARIEKVSCCIERDFRCLIFSADSSVRKTTLSFVQFTVQRDRFKGFVLRFRLTELKDSDKSTEKEVMSLLFQHLDMLERLVSSLFSIVFPGSAKTNCPNA